MSFVTVNNSHTSYNYTASYQSIQQLQLKAHSETWRSPLAELGFTFVNITRVTWNIQQCLATFTFLDLGVKLHQCLIVFLTASATT